MIYHKIGIDLSKSLCHEEELDLDDDKLCSTLSLDLVIVTCYVIIELSAPKSSIIFSSLHVATYIKIQIIC